MHVKPPFSHGPRCRRSSLFLLISTETDVTIVTKVVHALTLETADQVQS